MPTPLILYDGWALAFQPNSPAALHLLALLALHPAGVGAAVALPAPARYPLPGDAESLVVEVVAGRWGRLDWEQRRLSALAHRLGATWVHQFSGSALLGGPRSLLSPAADWEMRLPGQGGGLPLRLREALARGGAARASLAWPDDLPVDGLGRLLRLPVAPPLAFYDGAVPGDLPELPETYLLYHGSLAEAALRPVLQAWSWAAGSIGEYYPLLLLGFDGQQQQELPLWLAEAGLQHSVRLLPPLSPGALVCLYQGCSALFHPGEAQAWGDPARMALALGRPLVGLELPRLAAMTGAAAYLAPPGDPAAASRLLGAALISVVVEESLAQALGQQAKARADAWQPAAFIQALERLYRSDG